MLTNGHVQSTSVRALTEDTFQLKIHLEDFDLLREPHEFYLDYQQVLQLIDQCRSALK